MLGGLIVVFPEYLDIIKYNIEYTLNLFDN